MKSRSFQVHFIQGILVLLLFSCALMPTHADVTNRFVSGKTTNGSDYILEVVGENTLNEPSTPGYTITLTMGSFGANVTSIVNIVFSLAFYSVIDNSVIVKKEAEATIPIKYAGSGTSQVISLTLPSSYKEVSSDLYFGAIFYENVSNSLKRTQINLIQAFTVRLNYNLSQETTTNNMNTLSLLATIIILTALPIIRLRYKHH